jgi:tetratricopeptide (TPR) repeat protein
MAKTKKQTKKSSAQIKKVDVDYNLNLISSRSLYIGLALAVMSVLTAVYYVIYAFKTNGYFGFPLDDPWIHLTFAKNFSEYFSFSFYKNEMVTAGSTSPIYTFLISLAFFVTENEFILSYFFGILFFAVSVFAFYKLSGFDFGKEYIYTILVLLIFVADKWLNFISVSGMETTMFIFILIASAYFYKKRNAVLFGVFLGLIIWTRPDGVAFIAALLFDYLIAVYLSKKDKKIILFSKQDLLKIGIIAGIIVAVYFVMNLILSGSLLPNTYNAKLTYYTPEFRSRSEFFKNEVWKYFTSGSYSIIMFGFFLAILYSIRDFFKKIYNPNILYIGFTVALILIYYLKLPYAHRFGRYLMPVIPFFILASGLSIRDTAKMLGGYFRSRNAAIGIIIVVLSMTLIYSFTNFLDNRKSYAEECKYINDRQVTAALWINHNTKETDIIATHDVGAIGYYSGRKLIDVAGLVTPELIDKIHLPDYNKYMMEYLKNQNVSYLVFLQEWYRISNANPLFSTAETLPPEVMEIYKYEPGKTLILNTETKSRIMYCVDLIGKKNYDQAVNILKQGLVNEPNSALIYFIISICQLQKNDMQNAEINLRKSLQIFPEYRPALGQLGLLQEQKGNFAEAKTLFEKYLTIHPEDIKIQEHLNTVNDSLQKK